MKTTLQNYSVVVILFFLAVLLQKKYIREFPSNIHAWAQSDHYALAQGFTNNGFNFFKPETFVYNHQFPDGWTKPSDETITAVDFPLNNFIPAIFMKLLNRKSPWIYRCYILGCSLIGLFFLFQLARLSGNNFTRSLFITLIAAASPLFVYYQGGFLPTIPSLTLAITGIYFYYKFLKHSVARYFKMAIAFLTLAALCRTTFAIPLIAVFSLELLKYFTRKNSLKGKIIPAFLSVSLISGYFIYNAFLRNKYGSIFLSHFLPPENVSDIREILRAIKINWAFTYFSKTQLLIITGVIIASLYFYFIRKEKINQTNRTFLKLTGIIFLGCLMFFFLLMKQFPAHDYYFLDTFFLPVLLIILLLFNFIPEPEHKLSGIISFSLFVLLCIPMVLHARESQEKRRINETWDKTNQTILNFKNADQLLDSLQIPASAKVLAIDIAAPNIPFLLMQRKGFAVLSTEKDLLEKAVSWDFDYAIIQNQYFRSDIYSDYPEFIDKIKRIADNGKISLCVKRQANDSSYFRSVNFEHPPSDFWQNVVPVNYDSFSGSYAGIVSPTTEFGVTFKSGNLSELKRRSCFLAFSGMFKSKILNDCELVVSVMEDGKNISYQARNLRKFLSKKNKWEKLEFLFEIPKIKSENYEIAVYIWNTGKSEILVDDFGFKIF